MRKIFTKEEVILTIIIFSVIAVVSLFNFRAALMRSRDVTRRDDLGAISNALNQFYEDFGYFPPSEDGKIKFCKGDNFEEVLSDLQDDKKFDRNKFFEGLRTCEWGQDNFDDLLDEEYLPYIKTLPADPTSVDGASYLYLSNTKRFQIFAHLEEDEALGYNPSILARRLECGNEICNFGKSFAQTPLDISLQQYEEQLERERLENNQ